MARAVALAELVWSGNKDPADGEKEDDQLYAEIPEFPGSIWSRTGLVRPCGSEILSPALHTRAIYIWIRMLSFNDIRWRYKNVYNVVVTAWTILIPYVHLCCAAADTYHHSSFFLQK